VCRHCLSRRSFHKGLLATAVMPPCVGATPETALVEPAISLAVLADAPRTVALTLDACSGATDMRIVETLIALSIPVTIFASGLWLPRNAPMIALMRTRAELFSVQNHGERHLPPVLGTRRVYGLTVAGTMDAIQREVARGGDMVIAARGERAHWYRGAAGLYSPPAIAAIQAMGWSIAGYSLNADEGASLPAASVAKRIAAARSGDVIVAHVNQPHRASGAGVADGIAALKQAGAVFVSLDALPTTPPVCRTRGL
jgi:peptidoglycan/xylan/chitin deacetylase (PgdA/CDA1 family)